MEETTFASSKKITKTFIDTRGVMHHRVPDLATEFDIFGTTHDLGVTIEYI